MLPIGVKLRRNWVNLLILALLAVPLEYGLRSLFPEPVHTYFYGLAGELWNEDPDLFWVPVHGYRDELARADAADAERLVYVFGGSIPTNFKAATNFPAECGKCLGPDYAVANFSTGGYTTHQSLILFRRMIERKPPKVAVICHGYNDRGSSLASDRAMARHNGRPSVRLLHALSGSKIVQLFRKAMWKAMGYDPYLLTGAHANIRRRVPLADFEENLRAFAAEAESRGVPLVFLTQAVIDEAVAADLDPYFETMRAVAESSEGVWYDDVRPEVFGYYRKRLGRVPKWPDPDEGLFLLHADLCHLNEAGHEFVGRNLCAFFKENNIFTVVPTLVE